MSSKATRASYDYAESEFNRIKLVGGHKCPILRGLEQKFPEPTDVTTDSGKQCHSFTNEEDADELCQ